MRHLVSLIALVSLAACVHPRPTTAPVPERLVVDSGAAVRVRVQGGELLHGRLLAPFTPTSPELVVCDTSRTESCATADAPGVRRVRAAELIGVAVRGKQGGNFLLLGLYAGAVAGGVTGGVAYDDRSGGSYVLGGVLGGALGYLIGSHVTGWVPLFPCGPHGQCLWRGAWPAGRDARR